MPLKPPPAASRLCQVADAFDTPTYVYVEDVIRHRIEGLRRHLSGVPLRLLYAMKANAHPAILAVMREAGLGIDVVSPGEMRLTQRVGFAPGDLLFSANNMTDAEMHEAHAQGVLLNIGELSRLERYGRAYPGSAVCIRINPQVGGGHHEHVITAGARSKFGIPVEQYPVARAIAARHGLRLIGLHQHIGSGILDPGLLRRAVDVLLRAALEYPDLRFLNFGGGLGVAYEPDQAPLDLAQFRRLIVEPLAAFQSQYPGGPLEYWFEPGRYLVAEAGVLLMRVNTLKQANGKWFAGTDSGMGHLVRPAIYGAYHGLYNLSNPEGPLRPYDVVGNICESADLFARDRMIQEIREGDVLAVLDAGAYGMTMASAYNLRPFPAEVLLSADPAAPPRLIRRRQSIDAFLDTYLSTVAAD